MTRLHKCTLGGGSACKNQGGDGSTFHKSGFLHPFPSVYEGIQVSDPCSPLSKSLEDVCVDLVDLEDDFDDDLSKAMLGIHLGTVFNTQSFISKALYEIDLDSPEGITKVLELLPILDPEILKVIYSDIFPGYDANKLSPRIMRIEIRGYLMDSLEALGERPAGSEATAEDSVSEGENEGVEQSTTDNAPVDESGVVQEGSTDVGETAPTA